MTIECLQRSIPIGTTLATQNSLYVASHNHIRSGTNHPLNFPCSPQWRPSFLIEKFKGPLFKTPIVGNKGFECLGIAHDIVHLFRHKTRPQRPRLWSDVANLPAGLQEWLALGSDEQADLRFPRSLPQLFPIESDAQETLGIRRGEYQPVLLQNWRRELSIPN